MLKRLKNADVAKAVANLFWLGLERLAQIAVAILVSGLLARYFGPDVFGKWQYANTLLLVLAPITWVCGAEILVPTIVHGGPPGQPRGLGTILGSAFALRFAVSAAALLLTLAVLALGTADVWGSTWLPHAWLRSRLHFDPLVAAMVGALAVTMIFREPFVGVINAWLQSMTYAKPQLLTSMASAVIKAALVVLLVHGAAPPTRFAWLWVLEAAAIGAVLVAYYRARHGSLDWHVDRTLFRHFSRAGTVFWLGLICMYLFLKLDRLVLERYVSFAELGRYSAAQQINENWITLALMLAQTLAPAFVYRIADIAQLKRNIWRLTALTALVMIVGAAVLDLLGGFIILRVFGPDYAAATGIFRLAVWLSVPAGIEAIGNLVVLKYQAKFVLLAKWLLALAVALAVDIALIPRFGGRGALLGLAAGYLAAAAVNFYYIRLKLHQ